MAQTGEQTDNHKDDESYDSCLCGKSDSVFDSNVIKDKFLEIKNKIAPCKPRIIGVTKYYGLDSIIKGYEAGIRNFGESRAVESVKKIEALPDNIRQNSAFHFIGHLQTNKADKVVRNFDYIHSVDSLKLASVISKEVTQTGRDIKLLLQLNNAGEVQKSGYSKEDLLEDLPKILELKNLQIVGLMNIAPLGADNSTLRALFKDVRDFRDELERIFKISLPELSMGMSDDYETAVCEGATMIRIGRKLFT